MGGRRPKRSNPNMVILQGSPLAPVLDFRFRLLLPLPGVDYKEGVSPSEEFARKPCSSSTRARDAGDGGVVQVMVAHFLMMSWAVDGCANYQRTKRGGGRACMSPNAIWADTWEGCCRLARELAKFGRGGRFGWDGMVATCNVVASTPHKGRVVVVQGSQKHPYPTKNVERDRV